MYAVWYGMVCIYLYYIDISLCVCVNKKKKKFEALLCKFNKHRATIECSALHLAMHVCIVCTYACVQRGEKCSNANYHTP